MIFDTVAGSITVGARGSISNTEQNPVRIQRSTNNHLREAVSRAATKVRSRRVTKITETTEQGMTQEVVRLIRNPNECRALTLDFHEVLAHYTIGTTFLSDEVGVVVLIRTHRRDEFR